MALADFLPLSDARARLTDEIQRAFGRRVFAVVIDAFVLSAVNVVVDNVFGVMRVTSVSNPAAPYSLSMPFTTSVDAGWLTPWVIWLAYCLILEALLGATIGKWLMGLRVTDLDARRPRLPNIFMRNAFRLIDSLTICYAIGGFVALQTPLRQRIGDRVARTTVAPVESLPAPLFTPPQLRRRVALMCGVVLLGAAYTAAFFYYGRPPLVVENLINTRQMMFSEGVSAYSLGTPTWGQDTITYQITYRTEQPVDTCHTRLTLHWTFPNGWEPWTGETSCASHTP